MKRIVTGIVVSTVALYMWGFLYWGISPLPYTAWKQSVDDAATGEMLREQFPENGTYYVPGLDHEAKTLEELFASGPVAFVHMLARDGRPQHDSSIMIQGFILNLVVVSLLALLLVRTFPPSASFVQRVRFGALAGLTAAVLSDFGDAVWWSISWEWKVHQAVYDFSAWLIATTALAPFLRGGAPAQTDNVQ